MGSLNGTHPAIGVTYNSMRLSIEAIQLYMYKEAGGKATFAPVLACIVFCFNGMLALFTWAGAMENGMSLTCHFLDT